MHMAKPNTPNAPKILRLGLFSLIGLEIGLALAYLRQVWIGHTSPPWLDLNGMRSLPSLLQASHLFAIGLIALGILIGRQRMARPVSWVLPLALALLCFYGGCDELIKLHLQLTQYNWQYIYLAILAAIPILCWRDLIWLWCTHRSIVLWVLLGITIFLLGGFGGEAIKTTLHNAFRPETMVTLIGTTNRLQFLAEHIRITIEEFSELLGESLILFGVAQFAYLSLATCPAPDLSVHPS